MYFSSFSTGMFSASSSSCDSWSDKARAAPSFAPSVKASWAAPFSSSFAPFSSSQVLWAFSSSSFRSASARLSLKVWSVSARILLDLPALGHELHLGGGFPVELLPVLPLPVEAARSVVPIAGSKAPA